MVVDTVSLFFSDLYWLEMLLLQAVASPIMIVISIKFFVGLFMCLIVSLINVSLLVLL